VGLKPIYAVVYMSLDLESCSNERNLLLPAKFYAYDYDKSLRNLLLHYQCSLSDVSLLLDPLAYF